MSECYFCPETERLEQHHIVPRRFGGSDNTENLVTVCPTCHSKLESLYNKRFYQQLGVDCQQEQQGKNTTRLEKQRVVLEMIEEFERGKGTPASVAYYEALEAGVIETGEEFDTAISQLEKQGEILELDEGHYISV